MRLVLLSVLVIGFAPALLAQDQPSPEVQEWMKKQVNLETTFRNPPEKWSKITFNRLNTVNVDGKNKVRYSLSDAKLDPQKHYALMQWELGAKAPKTGMPSVQVDAKGLLHCDSTRLDCPGGPGAEVNVAVPDLPGMPSRFILTGEDKQPVAMGEVIPNPITATDQSCTLEVTVLAPNAALTVVSGSGFTPGESIKFSSTGYDEHLENSYPVNEKGEFQTVLLPEVKGHDEGDTTVVMQGAKCKPTAQFHWGAPKTEAAPAAAPAQPPAPSASSDKPKN